ncbi:hypothetical protein F5Y13DRAFT_197313 [Hypoxylon sp. FL1857]|nr:hypothetical protein F5Y13DRAFT_197313 [Hypoxylon sp. FL1857]
MSDPNIYNVGWICAVMDELVAARAFLDETHDPPEQVKIERSEDQDDPTIHYGLIASGNQLMKDALIRDQFSAKEDILCFEMEAAGLMNHFPCIVIRGICDYSDTHKNKLWQGYAAMAAAAFAKDLLSKIAPNKVEAEKKLSEVLSEGFYTVNKQLVDIRALLGKEDGEKYVEKLTSWLSPTDPIPKFNSALRVRQPGTGSWFLQDKRYEEWKTKKNSFLWLNGSIGCGKTILTTTIIEDLSRSNSQSLLYFYFDFNNGGRGPLEELLRSLSFQLYNKDKSAQSELDSLYSCRGSQKTADIEALEETFKKMAQKAGRLWVVIDALDESDAWRQYHKGGLLEWIRNIQKLPMDIHLLVTSRPEQEIKSAIQRWAQDKDIIYLQSGEIVKDIREYIRARVRNSIGLSRWQAFQDVQREIEEKLMQKTGVMFRWAACQLDVLEDCLDYGQAEEALKSLPETLDETYSRIINNLPSTNRDRTLRVLQFLTYSERPLQIKELVDALAVKVSAEPRFESRRRMPKPEEVLKLCSSLVTVTTKTSGRHWQWNDEEESGAEEIRLAHYSVREYLVSNRMRNDIINHFSEVNARASIAEVCLAYLLHLGHHAAPHLGAPSPARVVELIMQLKRDYPLLGYAATYWVNHAVVVEASPESAGKLPIILEFLQCHNAFKLWMFVYRPGGQLPGSPSEPAKLSFASHHGLAHTAQRLIDTGANVNAWNNAHNKRDDYYGSNPALHCAVAKGHGKTVEVLLNNGADIIVEGNNALSFAARAGLDNMCQMLLGKGANINGVDGSFGTALVAAIIYGHHSTAKMLLDKGADINAAGGHCGTALHAAAYSQHEKMVKMLLDRGAEVNARGGQYGTALQAATYSEHKNIVKMLLDKGADVNAQCGQHGTALYIAVSKAHEDITKMLLDKGADVNAQGGQHGTALHVAAYYGCNNIATMLIDYGARINARNSNNTTPLRLALEFGNRGMIFILRRREAEDQGVRSSKKRKLVDYDSE